MHRKIFVLPAVLIVMASVLLQPAGVQARGWSWATRLPMSQFSSEDTEILYAHIDQALGEAEDGERVKWHNPDSGHSGVITPLTTEQINGMACRKTRFESQAGQKQNVSEFLLCQQPDGSWSVQSQDAQSEAAQSK